MLPGIVHPFIPIEFSSFENCAWILYMFIAFLPLQPQSGTGDPESPVEIVKLGVWGQSLVVKGRKHTVFTCDAGMTIPHTIQHRVNP